MRYSAPEKLEIIRLVEESHLSARRTLAKLGIPRTTFYRWYGRYLQRGEAGLQDQSPNPKHVWNRIPDEVRRKVVKLALKETELSPRELVVTFTDKESYFVSEASAYRILKAHDLITSPAFIVLKAANEFKDETTAINQLWQTDFTYLKVLGWGWLYLSTILDDYSRYIITWKLCTTMRAEDVTETLDLALQASGCDQVHVVHKPRLLSDNGSSYRFILTGGPLDFRWAFKKSNARDPWGIRVIIGSTVLATQGLGLVRAQIDRTLDRLHTHQMMPNCNIGDYRPTASVVLPHLPTVDFPCKQKSP